MSSKRVVDDDAYTRLHRRQRIGRHDGELTSIDVDDVPPGLAGVLGDLCDCIHKISAVLEPMTNDERLTTNHSRLAKTPRGACPVMSRKSLVIGRWSSVNNTTKRKKEPESSPLNATVIRAPTHPKNNPPARSNRSDVLLRSVVYHDLR